jgi:hypothetical protein
MVDGTNIPGRAPDGRLEMRILRHLTTFSYLALMGLMAFAIGSTAVQLRADVGQCVDYTCTTDASCVPHGCTTCHTDKRCANPA